MIKKILAVGLTTLMVLSFVGCSSNPFKSNTFESKTRIDTNKTEYTISPKSGSEKTDVSLRTDRIFNGLDETLDKYITYESNMSYTNFDTTVQEEKKLLSTNALKQFDNSKTQIDDLKKQLTDYKINSTLQDYTVSKVKYSEIDKNYVVDGSLNMKITSETENKTIVQKENFKLILVNENKSMKVENITISTVQ